MSIKNKIIGSFSILIIVLVLSNIYVAYNISKIKSNVTSLVYKDFKGIDSLLEGDRDSYQSSVALSQMINYGLTFLLEADRDSYQSNMYVSMVVNTEDKEKIQKLVKSANSNLNQVKERFDKFKKLLYPEMQDKKEKFNEFYKLYSKIESDTAKLLTLLEEKKYTESKKYYFEDYLKDYNAIRGIMDSFTEDTYNVIEKNQISTDEAISSSLNTFIIVSILSILVAIFFSFYLSRVIKNRINDFNTGLLGFFSYLNNETTTVKLLSTDEKDEIAKLSEIVNENIENTKSLLEKDTAVINDVKRVVEEVKNGNLNQKVNLSTHNKGLEELKTILNEMLSVMSKAISNDLNKIKTALEEFQKLNFTHRIENATGETVEGLNGLANIINDMLVNNKTNGITLQNSASTLLENVDILSKSSNEAAASLEETAAAIEEITSNIKHNTENVVKMANNANELKSSANEGENLATQTTKAMDAINEQTQSIAEAITVIDQIAFQTNILSLNAAVEAATAGEAGKGFAVVAAEVRNLASRSAEAAKEIKELVETATSKANDGKIISDKMIVGYSSLNKNISLTLDLISDVETASKEQQTGISQINDTINMLDRQTQQNASVASETKTIADETSSIANDIVQDANEKNFIGKDDLDKNQRKTKTSSSNKSSQTTKKTEPIKSQKVDTKPKTIKDTSSDDEWESF
ncbi:methyl-accepting chemotaxis protein [Arcobacter sp. CECT 8986]|uniref:HAMP domain-containing methyl-accepting chemotaxis protein n=1 Tax=Arcobacter sp. CECT 8986 TaxID=2044507 RepID=UPI001009E3FA|nr:methyl-accepting chemotaxis protein [Arcobacter sp. CECT 8986]RXJ99111.1 methyl-accepting chemotaxis protein [Arcobacter sp. CECT 8986]